ncbi:hypothetical protein NQ318_013453 [Aromia moschata]|uniref:Syntaxin N-terminal domain-containing protein n=1 Tax=Aromia moschata TaxID=1265417 RepID=A0AAV8YN37_9CUCU|nr:hypothetical protein NQ318_013453 [Aromia moschata]
MSRPPQNYGSIESPVVGFNDNTSEFNSFCDNVVTNIYTINSSLKTLESALKSIGTKKDNQGFRNKIHVTQLMTTRDFGKLKLIVAKGDKQKQLQVEKLEGNFKEAVNRYYALQKEVASKQKEHLLVSPSFESETAQDDDYRQQQQQRQEQMTRELEFEQDMMLEREARIKQIEADVLDINQIMRELGAMIQLKIVLIMQLAMWKKVLNNFVKASQYQTRYRKKLLYLILIGIIVVAILITILVTSIKKS